MVSRGLRSGWRGALLERWAGTGLGHTSTVVSGCTVQHNQLELLPAGSYFTSRDAASVGLS